MPAQVADLGRLEPLAQDAGSRGEGAIVLPAVAVPRGLNILFRCPQWTNWDGMGWTLNPNSMLFKIGNQFTALCLNFYHK